MLIQEATGATLDINLGIGRKVEGIKPRTE
jgi:hypothetical protein